MALIKLDLRPGVAQNSTEYSQTGGWYSCDRVRFRAGKPETIGGWTPYTSEAFVGVARCLFRFSDLSGTIYTFIGTTVKAYIESGGQLYDVTPIRDTNVQADPISTTNGSTIVTVTDAAHGANIGDYVIISGSAAVGGVAANAINGEHIITSKTTNTWSFVVESAATSTVAAGGGSVTLEYLYYSGSDSTVYGSGWGTGTWGRGTWGSGSDSVSAVAGTRTWHVDRFGEDLVVCARDGAVFYWDATTPDTRMIYLTDLPGASDAPEMASRVLVSQSSRHVIAFGCDALSSSTQDRTLVRWSDQEDAADWTPSTTNQAGDLILNKGSKIVTAVQTRSDILIFTDQALYNMQYIGGQLVFGIMPLADNIYIAGVNSAIAINDSVYWISNSGFHIYNGRVQPIFCSLADYVLNDINWNASDKIYASSNLMFNEVTWWYQSVDSVTDEVDSYVTYNYLENVWYYGHLPRTAWIDDPGGVYPIAASTDGIIYTHEYSRYAKDFGVNRADIGGWIESAPIEIGDGDKFMFVDRLIPDIDFTGSASDVDGEVTITLTSGNYPMKGGTGSSVKVVEGGGLTDKKNVRIRGRTVKIKIESSRAGTHWNSGINRIDIREDGAR